MEITAALVKELREKTGVGMMDCKKALAETEGDIDKAVELLRKKGLAAAAKKAGRIASEGLVGAFVSDDHKVGSLVEVNCETDFVARNPEFGDFVKDVARHVAQGSCPSEGTGESIASDKFLADPSGTVEDAVNTKVAKIGEKISIRRFVRFEVDGNGLVGSYIHLGGKIGVLIELSADKDLKGNADAVDLARDLAMQVAASNPQYVRRDEVPSEATDAERRILAEQEDIKSKPENVREKIVEGRINKYFEQVCLVEQAFIKDPSLSVKDLLKQRGSKLGASVDIKRFVRFVLGEGIEKKSEDFAAEVASYMGGK